MKKKKDDDSISILKLKKILKIIAVLTIIIILLEGAVFLYLKYNNEKSNIYYESFNMTIKEDDNYLAVGSSYFKNSSKYKYTNGIEKGLFIKYDKNNNIDFEIQYDRGYNSTFTSILAVEDGYIITGSCEYNDYQTENNVRNALLIKYDKKGNKLWEKNYEVRTDTRFNKVIKTNDGLIVIGQSIYEKMEVGNHTDGGGIIVKYDFDGNEIWHNNHGGNKSGNFNGIVEVDNNFYVVGIDSIDTGNLVKFNSKGEYEWHVNYSYTDNKGFQDITYLDNNLYVVGSKKILEETEDLENSSRVTSNTDALIIKYDLKGNIKSQETFGGTSYERYISIKNLNDKIYVFGVSCSTDSKLDIKLNDSKYSSMIAMEYNNNLELQKTNVIGGSNNDMLNNVTLINDKFYLAAYSNSKDGNIKTKESNGKDYFGKIIEIDTNLNESIIK